MKVYIDPSCNILYSSYYIIGLREIFGKNNIVFSNKPFRSLSYKDDTMIMAFVINGKRYAIDTADNHHVFYKDYIEWADLYGKVNFKKECIPQDYIEKIVPLSPNFAIACFGESRKKNIIICLINYLKSWKRMRGHFRYHLIMYLTLYKRKEITAHSSIKEKRKIFFVTRYWEGQEKVNQHRIIFIRTCKKLQEEGHLSFTGGMVPDKKENSCPKDVLLEKEIPYTDYIEGLESSDLVFNCPAYWDCHGWKLPEYMCQGKAILSTPFVNELPIPLEHKKHIYFCEPNEQAMKKAILEIINDAKLRDTMKENILSYWHQHACPAASVKDFIKRLQLTTF